MSPSECNHGGCDDGRARKNARDVLADVEAARARLMDAAAARRCRQARQARQAHGPRAHPTPGRCRHLRRDRRAGRGRRATTAPRPASRARHLAGRWRRRRHGPHRRPPGVIVVAGLLRVRRLDRQARQRQDPARHAASPSSAACPWSCCSTAAATASRTARTPATSPTPTASSTISPAPRAGSPWCR